MSFCPEWLYDLAVARVAQEFLSSSMPIYSFAQKYSKGLSESYEQVTPAELSDPAEEVLRFMAKVGISDTSDEVLQNYIFFKLNFEILVANPLAHLPKALTDIIRKMCKQFF